MLCEKMKKYYLQYKPKISLKKAIDKIATHAMLGEHMSKRPTTKAEVCNLLLSLGENPNIMAEKCRNWKENVPYFENLLGSTWNFPGAGKAEIVDLKTNKTIAEENNDTMGTEIDKIIENLEKQKRK